MSCTSPRPATPPRRRKSGHIICSRHYTAEEIARRIHLAPKTVANYRMSLKGKLGVQSRADLMRVVVESGRLANMLKAVGIERKNP